MVLLKSDSLTGKYIMFPEGNVSPQKLIPRRDLIYGWKIPREFAVQDGDSVVTFNAGDYLIKDGNRIFGATKEWVEDHYDEI